MALFPEAGRLVIPGFVPTAVAAKAKKTSPEFGENMSAEVTDALPVRSWLEANYASMLLPKSSRRPEAGVPGATVPRAASSQSARLSTSAPIVGRVSVSIWPESLKMHLGSRPEVTSRFQAAMGSFDAQGVQLHVDSALKAQRDDADAKHELHQWRGASRSSVFRRVEGVTDTLASTLAPRQAPRPPRARPVRKDPVWMRLSAEAGFTAAFKRMAQGAPGAQRPAGLQRPQRLMQGQGVRAQAQAQGLWPSRTRPQGGAAPARAGSGPGPGMMAGVSGPGGSGDSSPASGHGGGGPGHYSTTIMPVATSGSFSSTAPPVATPGAGPPDAPHAVAAGGGGSLMRKISGRNGGEARGSGGASAAWGEGRSPRAPSLQPYLSGAAAAEAAAALARGIGTGPDGWQGTAVAGGSRTASLTAATSPIAPGGGATSPAPVPPGDTASAAASPSPSGVRWATAPPDSSAAAISTSGGDGNGNGGGSSNGKGTAAAPSVAALEGLRRSTMALLRCSVALVGPGGPGPDPSLLGPAGLAFHPSLLGPTATVGTANGAGTGRATPDPDLSDLDIPEDTDDWVDDLSTGGGIVSVEPAAAALAALPPDWWLHGPEEGPGGPTGGPAGAEDGPAGGGEGVQSLAAAREDFGSWLAAIRAMMADLTDSMQAVRKRMASCVARQGAPPSSAPAEAPTAPAHASALPAPPSGPALPAPSLIAESAALAAAERSSLAAQHAALAEQRKSLAATAAVLRRMTLGSGAAAAGGAAAARSFLAGGGNDGGGSGADGGTARRGSSGSSSADDDEEDGGGGGGGGGWLAAAANRLAAAAAGTASGAAMTRLSPAPPSGMPGFLLEADATSAASSPGGAARGSEPVTAAGGTADDGQRIADIPSSGAASGRGGAWGFSPTGNALSGCGSGSGSLRDTTCTSREPNGAGATPSPNAGRASPGSPTSPTSPTGPTGPPCPTQGPPGSALSPSTSFGQSAASTAAAASVAAAAESLVVASWRGSFNAAALPPGTSRADSAPARPSSSLLLPRPQEATSGRLDDAVRASPALHLPWGTAANPSDPLGDNPGVSAPSLWSNNTAGAAVLPYSDGGLLVPPGAAPGMTSAPASASASGALQGTSLSGPGSLSGGASGGGAGGGRGAFDPTGVKRQLGRSHPSWDNSRQQGPEAAWASPPSSRPPSRPSPPSHVRLSTPSAGPGFVGLVGCGSPTGPSSCSSPVGRTSGPRRGPSGRDGSPLTFLRAIEQDANFLITNSMRPNSSGGEGGWDDGLAALRRSPSRSTSGRFAPRRAASTGVKPLLPSGTLPALPSPEAYPVIIRPASQGSPVGRTRSGGGLKLGGPLGEAPRPATAPSTPPLASAAASMGQSVLRFHRRMGAASAQHGQHAGAAGAGGGAGEGGGGG